MNLQKPISTLVLLMGISCYSATALDLADDFSLDSGQWRSQSGGAGTHAIRNGRLEFSTKASTNNDSATHVWKVPLARYDESWEIKVDVFLGDFRLGKDLYAGLALNVGTRSNSASSFIRLQLRRGGQAKRAFNVDAYASRKFLASQWQDTSGETAILRLQFDAKTKVITASYDADARDLLANFVTFYTLDIGKSPGSWRMRDKDTFEFSLVSQSTRSGVASGDMFFDNVVVRNLGP